MAMVKGPRRRRKPSIPKSESTRVLAYLRVSTDEQSASGLGLAAQRAAIERAAAYQGWQNIQWIADEGFSGKHVYDRPGLTDALRNLFAGEASVLVAAK